MDKQANGLTIPGNPKDWPPFATPCEGHPREVHSAILGWPSSSRIERSLLALTTRWERWADNSLLNCWIVLWGIKQHYRPIAIQVFDPVRKSHQVLCVKFKMGNPTYWSERKSLINCLLLNKSAGVCQTKWHFLMGLHITTVEHGFLFIQGDFWDGLQPLIGEAF